MKMRVNPFNEEWLAYSSRFSVMKKTTTARWAGYFGVILYYFGAGWRVSIDFMPADMK
ncbi:MAG: hypothetical protein AAGC78_13635 [Cellvibrio sp.]|uniref:hypothetical protein n=1 Tax=Cellvibrio sp. TaxID=1965322 RepID=UPI0031AB0936